MGKTGKGGRWEIGENTPLHPKINLCLCPCVHDRLGRRVVWLPNLAGAVCISVVLAELSDDLELS